MCYVCSISFVMIQLFLFKKMKYMQQCYGLTQESEYILF